MKPSDLKEKFYDIYGNRINDPVIFFSPGRVNLIGEHTDYNSGFVFPCALNYGTYLAVRKNSSKVLRLHTLNFTLSAELDANRFLKDDNNKWINYPLGVADQYIKRGFKIPGLDLLYYGDIPNGAGLSSSASIEMATAIALNYFIKANLSTIEMVKMCQEAENSYVGMNCGIMDQFAVGFGARDMAIFLNCGTLKYNLVPLELNDYRLVIVNTNKSRGLTDSKYNERRSECEEALAILRKSIDIEHLSELGLEHLSLIERELKSDTIRRRARHIITENARVLSAVNALHNGNLEKFGQEMNKSHDSLKDNYEVSGIELDTLVYEARKLEGVIGSRMTGAGFGGCTVNLVHKDSIDNFVTSLGKAYSEKIGLIPSFYHPAIGDGASILSSL